MSDSSQHSALLRKRFLIIGLVLAIAAAAPFAYRATKKLRAKKLANQSLADSETGEVDSAQASASAAFNLDPNSPLSLRAMANAATTPSDAFFFYHALIHSNGATPEDMRGYLQHCQSLNFAASIDGSLQRLLAAEPEVIGNWLLAGRLELQRGRNVSALNCAQRALDLDSKNRRAQMLAAQVALESSEENFRAAGRRTLQRLIDEAPEDKSSLEAAVALLPATATAILDHPKSTTEQKLLAARAQFDTGAGADDRAAVIEQTIARHRGELPRLLHWLNEIGASDRALELCNQEQALGNPELFTAWCHAKVASKQGRDLVELCEDSSMHSKIPLPPHSLELVLVDAFESLGEKAIADIHWGKLVRTTQTGNRKGKLLRLAQWADRHGFTLRAIETYRALIEESPTETPHWYDRIADLARRGEQLPLLRQVTEELHQALPDSIVYRQNLAYLSALAGTDLDRSAQLLTSLIDQAPEAGQARCALALVERRRGNDAAAAAQLAVIAPESLDPASRFIYQRLSGQSPAPPPGVTRYEIEALDRL